MKRRTFIMTVGGAALGLSRLSAAAARNSGDLPRRTLGKAAFRMPAVGFPGLALSRYSQEECNRAIPKAFDLGVNHFDVAPAYGDAEIKMGPALQGIPREKYFLSCKTKMRDAKGAQEELERSLRRLRTDYFDLYQLHHLRRPEEVERALGPGGAMETILKAREEGKVRLIGFSAHTTKSAILALKKFPFDTVMFPVNFVEMFKIGFGKPVVELAAARGTAVIAIKPIAAGAWKPGQKRNRPHWYPSLEEQEQINMAMRFTLSQKAVVTAIPTSFLDLFEKAVAAGKVYRPISPEETDQLRKIAAQSLSLFKREEDRVALSRPLPGPVHPGSPHEDEPGGLWA